MHTLGTLQKDVLRQTELVGESWGRIAIVIKLGCLRRVYLIHWPRRQWTPQS